MKVEFGRQKGNYIIPLREENWSLKKGRECLCMGR
jgi:hypothetical protein